MKVISFLGTGDYKNISYKFSEDQIITTLFFPSAVNQYFNPEEHYILMTEEARDKHSEKMSEMFKFHEVIIPFGKDEDQFWEIFDDIAECIEENDEVILDFTYGFRSQPVLAIAALIYLKALKNIRIKNVIYGAFEAKVNDVVPVFDLISFVELIDWSNAVRDFLKYGKSADINKLLREIQISTYKNNIGDKATGLISAGNSLIKLSQAMSIVNTKEIFEQSKVFSTHIEKLIEDLKNIKKTKPIGLILNEIVKRIEPVSSAEKILFNEKGIEAQINIIQWYMDTEQFQQAITLMNEMFISLQCIKNELDPISSENRNQISKKLGEVIQKMKSGDEVNEDGIKLWSILIETRNEINHAGMRENNTSSVRQIGNIKILFEQLQAHITENQSNAAKSD